MSRIEESRASWQSIPLEPQVSSEGSHPRYERDVCRLHEPFLRKLTAYDNPAPSRHCEYRIQLVASVAAVLMLCMAAAIAMTPRSVAYEDPETHRPVVSLRKPTCTDQLASLTDARAPFCPGRVREARAIPWPRCSSGRASTIPTRKG